MKPVPMIIADMQIDLRGCEYHESQQLTHIDGFLVYYNGRGRLTLRMSLTDQEKLDGVHRLLSQLEQPVMQEPTLYFWAREDVDSTHAHSQARQASPASATTWLDPVPVSRTLAERASLLHVPRVLLYTAARKVVPQRLVHRGQDQEEHTFVDEDTPSGHHASLSLVTPNGSTLSLLVQLEPATVGLVGVTLGSRIFQAPLTALGTARLDGIPPELLVEVDGPDLEVWLEQAVTDEPR